MSGRCMTSVTQREKCSKIFSPMKHFVSSTETLCFRHENKVFLSLKQKTAFFFIKTRIWPPAKTIIPNRSLGCYALTRFLFVICPAASRLQWNPIAHSKRQGNCSKIKDVIIITLMTDWGSSLKKRCAAFWIRAHKACEKKRFAGTRKKAYLCILITKKNRKEDGRDT